MKATITIKQTENDKHIVVIDNGNGNTITMTDEMTFKECLDWVDTFKKVGVSAS